VRIFGAAAVFGLGYVLGSKAGRERYAQIMSVTRNASERLDTYRRGGVRSMRSARDRQHANSTGTV
jgi:hypothetical protein